MGNIAFILNKLSYLFMYFVKQFWGFFVFIPWGQQSDTVRRESGGGEKQQAQAEIQNLAAVTRTQHWYYKKLF